MIFWLLGGLGALILSKGVAQTPAQAAQAHAASQVPAGVASTIAQTTKNPASASAQRANAGNSANQPWYQGAATKAGSQAGVEILKGIAQLGSLFQSSSNEFDDSSDESIDEQVVEDDSQSDDYMGDDASFDAEYDVAIEDPDNGMDDYGYNDAEYDSFSEEA